MSTLFIDADACPVTREAISVARAAGWDVVVVANASQNFERFASRKGVEVISVSHGADAVDFAIVERLSRSDVVVTQDIGLAAMALGRGAHALSPRGRRFHQASIDAELLVRHEQKKLRRAGGRHAGPAAFTDEDREHFGETLEWVLRDAAKQ